MFHTIRSKLLFWILVPMLTIYVIVAALQTHRQVRDDLDVAMRLLRESVEMRAARCDTEFAEIAATLQTVLNRFADHPTPTETDSRPFLTRCVESNPRLLGLGISYEANAFAPGKEFFEYYYHRDEKGKIVPQTETSDFEYRTRDWYVKAVDTRRSVWGEPYIGNFPVGVKMCSLSAPLFQGEKLFGVLIADVSLSEIHKIVQADPPPETWFTLVSPTGKIISDVDESLLIHESLFSLAEKAGRGDFAEYATKLLQGDEPLRRIVPLPSEFPSKKSWNDGKPFRFVAAPMRKTGWILLAATPESAILQPIYTRLWKQHALVFLALLVVVGGITYISARLAGSLRRLTDLAEELARGNLDARIRGKRPNDEIGRLASVFDKMVLDLKSNIEQRIKEESVRKTVEGELRVARRIQASLLPRIFPPFPHRKEFDLHAMNEPSTFIAGDFFDFFFMDQDTLTLVMADVSGHGVPSAMFMAVSRTAIRNFTIPGRPPHEIMEQANTVLNMDNDDMMFVTVFYAHYNVVTGRLTYVNAGHNPPYLLRSDGTVEKLESTGPLLAAFDGVPFEEQTVELGPGDVLVTFTDGVTEAYAEEDDILFGEERFEQLIREIRNDPVETICDEIYEAVDRFSKQERHDDVTLLVLRRN